jgi:ribosomal peptide maturation radical SAM protein 1
MNASESPVPLDLASRTGDSARVALVSMPWMAPAMPSIQLAVLAAALKDHGITSDRHELYLDYATYVGVTLYKIMGSQSGFIPEWVFSRHYYRDASPGEISRFREVRPRIGLASRELEDDVLNALCAVTDDFLADTAAGVSWQDYAIIGFSLTFSQLGASMAMAKLIRQVAPHAFIVFGGTACAGPMGPATLRACAEADAVVSIDGEEVFPELVRRVTAGESLAGLPGVHWRNEHGLVQSGPAGAPVHPGRTRSLLDYDPYFERLSRLGMAGDLDIWLPFEGSRGCWYGEKAQCRFCGLHEIMQFRSQPGDRVLTQLDALYDRHGIDRFFSVDLILPKDYQDSLLPELARRGGKWTIFYEVKSDLTYQQFVTLAAAGVGWIQPGIESLDHDLLRLMRKGVRPSHNLQLLRWCKELGVRPSWNLITGIPRAHPAMYDRMTQLMPLLYHLPPPSGVGNFQLHRFSPYFDQAKDHGIQVVGAHPLFRGVFPLPAAHLDELVYWHDFRLTDSEDCTEAIARVAAAARRWLAAYRAGAELSLTPCGDGMVVRDTRQGTERRTELEPIESALYGILATTRRLSVIPTLLDEAVPGHGLSEAAIERKVADWADLGLVYADRDRVLGLASRPAASLFPQTTTPNAYLE